MMNWCCICKKSGESIDHLMLHCEVARDVGLDFPSIWYRVSHAPTDGGAIG